MYKYAYFDIGSDNPAIQIEENHIVDLICHVFGYRGILISDAITEKYNNFITELICSLLCTLPSPAFEVMVAEYKLEDHFANIYDEDKIADLSFGDYQALRANGLQMLRHPSRAMYLLPVLFPKKSSIDYSQYSENIEKIIIDELADKNQSKKSGIDNNMEYSSPYFSDKILNSQRFFGTEVENIDWKMELSKFSFDAVTLKTLENAGIKKIKNLFDIPMSIIENLNLDKDTLRYLRIIKFLTLSLKNTEITQVELNPLIFNDEDLCPITRLNLKPDTLTRLLRMGVLYVEDITQYKLMSLNTDMPFHELDDFINNGIGMLFDIDNKYDREDLCTLIHGNSTPLLYLPINESEEKYYTGRTLNEILLDNKVPQSIKDFLGRKAKEYMNFSDQDVERLSIA